MLSNVYGHFLNRLWPYFWKYRHLWDRKWPEGYTNEESLTHPHRKLILEAVSRFEPFDSIFEYGSGPGPNLILLSKKYPGLSLYGYDISKIARLKLSKISNTVALNPTDLPPKKVDGCISDAALIYREKPIFLRYVQDNSKFYVGCEWHDDTRDSYRIDRNYVHNFKRLLPGCELRKLTWQDWQDEGWSTYGHIITWKK